MWGNAPRPVPVIEAKKNKALGRNLSVGFGPQREQSAALLRAAALSGKLPVYVRPREGASKAAELRPVPPAMLKRILPIHKGLPDHPTHVRGPAGGGADFAMATLVRNGQLVIRRVDFDCWYTSEHARGLWPSQTNRSKPRRGRPHKDDERLQNAILAIVQDGAWNAQAGIPSLSAELSKRGHVPPTRNTLASVVDRAFTRSGVESLRRPKRKPPTRGKP
jgi:hypothetical protein